MHMPGVGFYTFQVSLQLLPKLRKDSSSSGWTSHLAIDVLGRD